MVFSGMAPVRPHPPLHEIFIHSTLNIGGLHIGLICMLSAIGEKPQKPKFRVNSKELTHGLIQIHKSFTRRNLHTQAKHLLVLSGGRWGEIHTLPPQGLYFIGS